MIRLIFVLCSLIVAGPSFAQCVTTKRTADDPYAEYDLINNCRGSAVVHWTRTNDSGQTENGKWVAGGCKTTHQQYFKGKYDFDSIEFPQGGDGERCLAPGESEKRNDPPISGTATSKQSAARPTQSSESEPSTSEPSGVGKDSASRAEERLQFELATKIDTVAAWKAFLEAFPKGVNAEWAKRRLVELGDISPSSGKSEIKVSGQFSGKIHAEFQVATVNTTKTYSEGQLTGTSVKRSTIHKEVDYDIDTGPLLSASSASEMYRCGENSPISNPGSSASSSWVVRCGFARTSTSIVVNLDANGRNSGGGTYSAIGTVTLQMDGERCVTAAFKRHYSTGTTGRPIRLDVDIDDHSTSGTCHVR
jgi:hypothetical protein